MYKSHFEILSFFIFFSIFIWVQILLIFLLILEIGFDNTHSAKLNQLTCMISVADEEEKNKTIFARTSHSEPEKLEHLRDSLKHAIMTKNGLVF